MPGARSFNLTDSQSRVGVYTTTPLENQGNNALHAVIGITVLSTNQVLTMDVIAITQTGLEYTLFTSLPMVIAATYRYSVTPFSVDVAGLTAQDFIPGKFKIVITPGVPAQADTYAIDVELAAA